MKKLQEIFASIFVIFKFITTIIFALSFLFMVLNITFFYGFFPSQIHSKTNLINPFGLTIPLIWAIHLVIGFFGGMVFSKKRFLLAGSMGLFSAFLITSISLAYFSWRQYIITIEILFPLVLGTIPAVKLYDFLDKKYPLKQS